MMSLAENLHVKKLQALQGIIPDIRIVSFPDVPKGEDVTYWIKELGHSKQELLERCKAAPPPQGETKLESVLASDVEIRAIEWLWSKRFAIGKIGVIAGLPDEGKGQVLCYIAGRITQGQTWPIAEGRSRLGNVVILSAEEDPADSLVPRLMAAGADTDHVRLIKMVREPGEDGQTQKRMFSLIKDLEKLRQEIVDLGNVVAVMIDPITSYLGVDEVDSYRDTDVRAVLGPLKELAEEMRIAIIAIMHFNKKVDVTNALLRISNSLAFVGLPRHVYAVVDDAENERKLLVRAKNNDAAASDNRTLAYHFEVSEVGFDAKVNEVIRAPYIVWEPEYVDITANEAMQAAGENKSPGERDKAKTLLLAILADGREVPVDEIKDIAGGHGLSWRTVRRAGEDLNVIVDKDRTTPKGKWFWKLPEDGVDDAATQKSRN
jgi:putative DNA primase/helicase